MTDITNNDLLIAISQLIDNKLEPINQRLDSIETHLAETEQLLLNEDAKLYNYVTKQFEIIDQRFDSIESETRANRLAIETLQLNKELEIRVVK